MDFFCGSRMHACIAAFSSGVPVVPIAYSRKFAGLFGSLGYTIITDCRTQTETQVLEAVVEAFQRRNELKIQLESGRAQACARLEGYEAVLREILSEVVFRRV
jgi:colanic acid/amylovoran biosynthesis protein